ncbi:PREDICTED: uncharacterized protein LOC105359623 [Ceratosolen solmsi marchali]|uniref:Uncharacterized protein LOC105359623 n=1 Tax=Ceratosolen solmsi marchali TaxID=326594 RepID=A0AAJ6VLQ3_9HYME|nr:PREDICTED: uncharacterized protein LOC105359623 [Ceratosolen solmsi marchali]
MKYFTGLLVLAFVAAVSAGKLPIGDPAELKPETELKSSEVEVEVEAGAEPRSKRGLLYASPYAAAYAYPYTASFSYPYAYNAPYVYRSAYYPSYYSSYVLG